MMKTIVRAGLLFCLIFAGFEVSHASGQVFFFENPMVGEKMPNFTLETVQGGKQSFDAYRRGQKSIVFFWATWCPHCREEMAHLRSIEGQMKAHGIRLMLVDVGEKPAEVKNFLKDNGISYNVFLDQDSQVAEQLKLIGVPTFFYVDQKGMIRNVNHSLPDDYQSAFQSGSGTAG